MVSEIEIWRSAKMMVTHFGDLAPMRAEERAEICRSRADTDGWTKWTRIAQAILEMQGPPPR